MHQHGSQKIFAQHGSHVNSPGVLGVAPGLVHSGELFVESVHKTPMQVLRVSPFLSELDILLSGRMGFGFLTFFTVGAVDVTGCITHYNRQSRVSTGTIGD